MRIQEQLKSEHDIDIPYSTLTRLLRNQQLRAPKQRSGRYRFEPGEEMQHDTSPHRVTIVGKPVTAQCAALVLGYSRLAFARYYPCFTRFEAKCFLADAVRFFDGAAKRCTIDNTSVLVVSGSGPDATIAPEMEAFGQLFGTRFVPHAIGHADRKAYVERLFSYIEYNFLAGRSFDGWTDLNAQLLGWCQNTANAKQKRSLGMSPQAAFVMEKPLLQPLPAFWRRRHQFRDHVFVGRNAARIVVTCKEKRAVHPSRIAGGWLFVTDSRYAGVSEGLRHARYRRWNIIACQRGQTRCVLGRFLKQH